MKRILALLFLGTLFFTSCSHGFLRGPASADERLGVRGLESLPLDQWTQGFFDGNRARPREKITGLATELTRIYRSSTSLDDFYAKVSGLGWNSPELGSGDLQILAEALFAARKHIRQSTDPGYRRQAVLLLSVLADETLFVHQWKFPGKLEFFKRTYLKPTRGIPAKDLNGTSVQSGDILLSKGDAGSSSFIARVVDFPGLFSHSTIAAVDPKSKRLGFIEAWIEDGVKYRDADEWRYVHGKPSTHRRIFVYRYHPDDGTNPVAVQKMGWKGAEQLLARMRKQVKDASKDAAYEYDLDFDSRDANKLFCSEVGYYAYELGGAKGTQNPYDSSIWSRITDIQEKFFQDYMEIHANTFPSPADVEMNPDWDLVAIQEDLATLPVERYDVALIDEILRQMTLNKAQVAKFAEATKPLDGITVTPELIAKAKELGLLSADQLAAAQNEIPRNVKLKQLIFFAFLNRVLAPNTRQALAQAEKSYAARTGRPMGLVELRSTVAPAVRKELEEFSRMAQAKIERLLQAMKQ